MPVNFCLNLFILYSYLLTPRAQYNTFLQVVIDHPDWWFLLKCDGFVSHINVTEALEKFFWDNIILAKEEGYTSHVTQSYDQ